MIPYSLFCGMIKKRICIQEGERWMDDILFKDACNKIINVERTRIGIGTLSEKTTHAVLKHFYEPDVSNHEIKIHNYIADIFKENEIIEIQTGNFNVMRKKLNIFLADYPVTIVYPIVHTKWLFWIDEETGQITKKRKSPKSGTPYEVFYELYKIKHHLTNPNLHLMLALIDTEEYRLLNGWSDDRKRGSRRYDRIPVNLADEVYIDGPHEYDKLIPDNLLDPFTTKDYAKSSRLSVSLAQTALNVLFHVGAVERIGKKGNAYVYRKKERTEHTSSQGTELL